MKALKYYVIEDSSVLRVGFTSSQVDDLKIMQYARRKVNCPYFIIKKPVRPYMVYRVSLINNEITKVLIGVIE